MTTLLYGRPPVVFEPPGLERAQSPSIAGNLEEWPLIHGIFHQESNKASLIIAGESASAGFDAVAASLPANALSFPAGRGCVQVVSGQTRCTLVSAETGSSSQR